MFDRRPNAGSTRAARTADVAPRPEPTMNGTRQIAILCSGPLRRGGRPWSPLNRDVTVERREASSIRRCVLVAEPGGLVFRLHYRVSHRMSVAPPGEHPDQPPDGLLPVQPRRQAP